MDSDKEVESQVEIHDSNDSGVRARANDPEQVNDLEREDNSIPNLQVEIHNESSSEDNVSDHQENLDNNTEEMAVTRTLRTSPFQPSQDDSSEQWQDWLEGLEREMRFLKITEVQDQHDALLIYAGREVVRLNKSIPDPPGDNVYEIIKKKLNDYFIQKKNKHHARYLFNRMEPSHGESTVTYGTRLREKASDCEFENVDDRILEHLIMTVDKRTLIQKAISKKLTLDQFLEEANQREEIDKQLTAMKTEEATVSKVGRYQQKNKRWKSGEKSEKKSGEKKEEKKKPCSYCNLTGKHPPGRNCPEYGRKCLKCGKLNHFAVVCRSQGNEYEGKKKKVKQTREMDKTEENDKNDETNSEEEACVYFNRECVIKKAKGKNSEEKTVTVKINDVKVKMEPDSGAEANVMDEYQFRSIQQKDAEVKLKNSKVKLKTIQGELTTRGEFIATISNQNHQVTTRIIVIAGRMDSEPLLGRETLLKLGMIRIDPEGRLAEPMIKKVQNKDYDNLVNRYNVFEGIGLIRDKVQDKEIFAKFNMKDNVNPVAQKARPVAYYLQKPLKEWMEKCIKEGIYERVPKEEAITWCSPLVVQPKPRYKEVKELEPQMIRASIDLRVPNK